MYDQHELYENARSRVKTKRRLYVHFIIFLICSVLFFIANKLLNYGDPYNWYIGGIVLWLFIWLLHAVNVFIVTPFMGKNWERIQTEKLIKKQEMKIDSMEKKMVKDGFPNKNSETTDMGLSEKKTSQ